MKTTKTLQKDKMTAHYLLTTLTKKLAQKSAASKWSTTAQRCLAQDQGRPDPDHRPTNQRLTNYRPGYRPSQRPRLPSLPSLYLAHVRTSLVV